MASNTDAAGRSAKPKIAMGDEKAMSIPFESPGVFLALQRRELPVSVVGKLEFLEHLKTNASSLKVDRNVVIKQVILSNKILELLEAGHSMYMYLRLFMPLVDYERKKYGLQEKQLGKVIPRAVGLGTVQKDMLENYADPKSGARSRAHHHAVSTGRFADTVFEVLQYEYESEADANLRKARDPTSEPPVRTRPSTSTSYKWTVGDINTWLDKLYAVGGGSLPRRKREGRTEDRQVELFEELWKNVTALGVKWVIRIILGDLHIGLREKQVLRLYHKEAETGLGTSNLPVLLHDPDLRPGHKGRKNLIQLGTPCAPMRCAKYAVDQGLGVEWSNFYVERKMDGERMMIHKEGTEVKIYSRNRVNQADYERQMKPYVLSCVLVESCILDGEMVAWSEKAGGFLPFGSNKVVSRLNGEREVERDADGEGLTEFAHAAPELSVNMCFLAFDIVYLKDSKSRQFMSYNGDITDLSLSTRKDLLNMVIPVDKEHHFEIHKAELVSGMTNQEERKAYLSNQLGEAMRRSDEGLIIKQRDSTYVPAKAETWLKVKPEYFDGNAEMLDVAIIGGYFGKGGRGGGAAWSDDKSVAPVASFLVAMPARGWADMPDGKDELGNPRKWTPLCRVGGGIDYLTIRDLRNVLGPHWVPVLGKDKEKGTRRDNTDLLPSWMTAHCKSRWTLKNDDIPDFVLSDPRHAIVMVMEGTEVIESSSFPTSVMKRGMLNAKEMTPVTIRFPRCQQIGWDAEFKNLKPLAECDTEEKLQDVVDNKGSRMYKVAATGGAGANGPRMKKAKRGIVKAKVKRNQFAADVRGTDLADVAAKTDVFRGEEVAVLQGSYEGQVMEEGGKTHTGFEAMLTRVTSLGGIFVPNPVDRGHGQRTKWVIGDGVNAVSQAYGEKYGYDVRNALWLLECETSASLPPARRRHFVFTNDVTARELDRVEDRSGDVHAADLASSAELESLLARVGQDVAPATAAAQPSSSSGLVPLPAPTLLNRDLAQWSREEISVLCGEWTLFRDEAPYWAGTVQAIAMNDAHAHDAHMADQSDEEEEEEVVEVEDLQARGKGTRGRILRKVAGSKMSHVRAHAQASSKRKRVPSPPTAPYGAISGPSPGERDFEGGDADVLSGRAPLTVAYIHEHEGVNTSRVAFPSRVNAATFAGFKIRRHGGQVCTRLDSRVNIVVVDSAEADLAAHVRAIRTELGALHGWSAVVGGAKRQRTEDDSEPVPHAAGNNEEAGGRGFGPLPVPIVASEWVDACIAAGRMVPVDAFAL